MNDSGWGGWMGGRKRILRVIAVLSTAVATGHAVETLRASTAPRGDLATLVAQPPEDGGAPGAALPRSASLNAGLAADMSALSGITSVAAPALRPTGDCAPVLSLTAAPDAMIDLALAAPCDPGERVVIRHAGLAFTARTGTDGRLALRLPALETDALVAAYFDGSQVALASVEVPGADQLARFAFQMAHPVRFELRADEGGQVLAAGGAAADPGRLLSLGAANVADPILAQVYSFPTADPASAEVTVELRITSDTCSHTYPAETVTVVDGAVVRKTLSVALPLCGTSGDILVLRNLVQDPTLAPAN